MQKLLNKLGGYLAILLLPTITLAQQGSGSGLGGGSGSGSGVSLENPLGNKPLMQFLQDILDIIMVFAVPLIIFFIIYAGFNYVMAQGNETKIKTANSMLLYAIIGGLIILGAKLILAVISGTVSSF